MSSATLAAAILIACGGGGGGNTSTSVPIPATPTLGLAYDVKTFKLSWTAVAPPAGGGAVTYRVTETLGGMGPSASTQIATDLSTTSYDRVVSGLLHTLLNATYQVQACNNGGCSALSTAQAVDVTRAIGYFKASNTEAGDFFGSSVALSSDGNTLAVGATGEDSGATGINGSQTDNSADVAGAVYVFSRSGNVWSQQAYLKASNADRGDQFGSWVSLSSDGNTLAVGTYSEASNATGINGNQEDNSVSGAGAVYVFARNGSAWSQQAYVKASNTGTDDLFGRTLALSGDGNTLAVGAIREGSKATGINGNQADNSLVWPGAVYVFTRNGSDWSQQAYVKASNTEANIVFGTSVALSRDGNTLAVGAPGEKGAATGINGNQADNSVPGSGAVYVFTRSGSMWSQQAYVKASISNGSGQFGSSVALSGDGNTLAVGAQYEASNATGINGNQADNSAIGAGAVYVFARADNTWSQRAYVKASNTEANDWFGASVALSSDGNTLAVRAHGEQSAAKGINGDQSQNYWTHCGAVYLFTQSGSTWGQQAYVKPSNLACGLSMALSGDGKTLAVGAVYEDSGATGVNGNQADVSARQSGAVYLY